MSKMILFCGSRTGSTSIRRALSDDGVRICFEPFHPDRFSDSSRLKRVLSDRLRRWDGIKHVYDHLDPWVNRTMIQWMIKHEVRIIYLRRRAKILQALSREISLQNGIWEYLPQDRAAALAYEYNPIDPDLVRNWIRAMELMEADYLMAMQDQALEVWYEDLFTGPMESRIQNYGRIREALGIHGSGDPGEWLGPILKQNGPDIFRRIPNIYDIEQEFYITLTEDQNGQA